MQQEYFTSGELKSEGNYIELKDCTSRGGCQSILIDDYDSVVGCVL